MSTDFVRDPVAEEARRHRLAQLTCIETNAVGETTRTVDLADARGGRLEYAPDAVGPTFYTHACTCGESFVSTTIRGSYDLFDEHLDAIEHGELS